MITGFLQCKNILLRHFLKIRLKNMFFCCIMLICGDIDNHIRKGEKMRFRKVQSAFLAAAMTCSLLATPVFADDTKESLENKKSTAQNELQDLQTQLNTLITKANDLELQLIAKGEEIIQAEADLDAAEEKREEQYEAMKLRIKYMYESGTGTATMEKVISSGDMSSILAQAEYSQQVEEYDRNQLQEYANTVTEIENLQVQLEEDMDKLEDLQVQYTEQKETLNATISSKQDEIENLDEMIQEAARKAQEEAERKAAEEKARQEAEAQAQAAASANSSSSSGSSQSGGSTVSDSYDYSAGSSAPSYDAVTGNSVVDRAYGALGCAYVWGACGPDSFDCSGLVSYCLTGSYSRLGTTYTFMGWPQVSDPQPGDICVNEGHCGIYIGGGQMIHAADYGIGVIVGPVQSGMIYVRY